MEAEIGVISSQAKKLKGSQWQPEARRESRIYFPSEPQEAINIANIGFILLASKPVRGQVFIFFKPLSCGN